MNADAPLGRSAFIRVDRRPIITFTKPYGTRTTTESRAGLCQGSEAQPGQRHAPARTHRAPDLGHGGRLRHRRAQSATPRKPPGGSRHPPRRTRNVRRQGRLGHHGDEQHLLPLPPPEQQRKVRHHAGPPAHAGDRQTRQRSGGFRALVSGRLGHQRLRSLRGRPRKGAARKGCDRRNRAGRGPNRLHHLRAGRHARRRASP